jgi:hypothetical protein
VHGKGLNHDEVCKQLAALGSQMAFFLITCPFVEMSLCSVPLVECECRRTL